MTENRRFDRINFAVEGLPSEEFQKCEFVGCNFTNMRIKKVIFEDCLFTGCHFGMTEVFGTLWRGVEFRDCRMSGMDFSQSGLFPSFRFKDCNLQLACFENMHLRETVFENCNMQEADLNHADFSCCKFPDCEFAGALFKKTNVEGADFVSARNYIINPALNQVRGARFSRYGIEGLVLPFGVKLVD